MEFSESRLNSCTYHATLTKTSDLNIGNLKIRGVQAVTHFATFKIVLKKQTIKVHNFHRFFENYFSDLAK